MASVLRLYGFLFSERFTIVQKHSLLPMWKTGCQKWTVPAFSAHFGFLQNTKSCMR